MSRDNYSGLLAFVTVAREGSFTRAAAQLGVSQSALSHTIRTLESSLGIRLLTRTTRNVSPTEAGERLYQNISPQMAEIDAQVQALSEFRDQPTGTVRITATDYAIRTILWPKLSKFLVDYPDIKIELICDYGLTDIAADRYDAGVRFGEQLAQDMIAVRIGPDERFALVGTKGYFARNPPPATPHDLVNHRCVNLRLPTHGGLYAWEFQKKGGREFNVRVEGQLVFNGIYEVLDGALAGLGLAYVPEILAQPHIAKGRLVRILEEWCPLWSGYHLYYPSRRQPSQAMKLVTEALRYQP
ncbi:LysR family transcriptional regulator [Achromobacter xylosoxidans]|jgi:DNA-binding transcriptional LysR family regulator|uniref:LysR family transcriptional regulator n=2 Tax=Achromobacter TaxID=222 RepID=A0A1R1JZK4_ALCXX|nr:MULTISPECIES: LysR family transcriptional regulator [Achromobacter]AZS81054.1 LysR family transcriptional regulator [Achromobacter spanius]OFS37189.1 LysR family transcriptional regulator [Achromobacter xylosoxidans]OMG92580.1 LysR family transcriptional regulator [Achromobacter xylosoxidans]CAB3629885.1 HTH-type transcriptional regulator PgrR [Achromobacter insuavis]CAB3832448.1 HTH-type transcriptional regulator PgrR [Achromobacter deleyi]